MAFDKDLMIRILGDSSKFEEAVNKSEKSMAKFAEKIGSIGRTMAIAGAAVTAVSVGLIKMASDAEETSTKFATVFQDISEEAAKTAKNLADNFGLSTKAAKQLLSDTGDLLTGFGFTGNAALDLSTKVNELAVDLASFTNYSGGAEGASAALTKALLGERESVKSLGISIMEVDVQAKVLEMTQQGLTFETERQAKAYATLLIAQEQSKNAIGDFARTSEGFANQMRILKGKVSDLGVALGDKLLPMATEMVKKAVLIVEKIKLWIEAHPKLVEWIAKLAFTLGIIAAVGGPILMATAAFLKVKTVIIATTTALHLLNIKMGATAAVSTTTLIPSLVSIGAKFGWLGAAAGPIAIVGIAAGGLYLAWKKNLFGMRDITIGAFNDIRGNFSKLEESMAGGGGGAGAFADEVDDLTDSIEGLGEKTDDTAEALDEFGNKIETFDEWVARLAEETAKANEEMAEAAEDAYKKYADAMQPIEDRLYELSHTEEEVAARNLLIKKNEMEEKIKAAELGAEAEKEAISKVKEVYEAEIALIIQSIEEKKQAEIDSAKATEESANIQKTAIAGIKKEYDELITKIDEVGKAAEAAAQKIAMEAYLAATPTIAETGYVPEYIPKYQTGTPYVPRTGLAMVHQGERITPASQNNNNSKSYSPTVNITVQGSGNANEIKEAVNQALEESAREFYRSGNALFPGMA